MKYIPNKSRFLRDQRYLDHKFIPEPECLVNLDKQLHDLGLYLSPIFYSGSTDPILIWGPIGTGKTTLMKILEPELFELSKKSNLDLFIGYSSNKKTSHAAFYQLTRNSGVKIPKRGYTFQDMIDMYLSKVPNRFNLFIIDEIHRIKDIDDLLYEMTRRQNILVIGITTDVYFNELVKDPSVKATFSDTKRDIATKAYDAADVKLIIEKRVEKAFIEGFISNEVMKKISGYIASKRGNIRIGLDIMKRIYLLSEKNNISKPGDSIVNQAIRQVEGEYVEIKLQGLNYHQKALLLSFYSRFKNRNEFGELINFFDVYNYYKSIVKSDPYSYKHCYRLIDDLSDLGFIRTKIVSYGKGKGRTTEIWPRYNSNWGPYYSNLKNEFDKLFI